MTTPAQKERDKQIGDEMEKLVVAEDGWIKGNGLKVARVFKPNSAMGFNDVHRDHEANAELIVKAVNAHDGLVDALCDIVASSDANDGGSLMNAIEAARNLLASLESQQ